MVTVIMMTMTITDDGTNDDTIMITHDDNDDTMMITHDDDTIMITHDDNDDTIMITYDDDNDDTRMRTTAEC